MLDSISDISEYFQQYSSYFEMLNLHPGKNPNSNLKTTALVILQSSVIALLLNYHHILNRNFHLNFRICRSQVRVQSHSEL